MKPEYHMFLESIYRQHHAAMLRWLQRRFPGSSFAEVQDAVADAFTEALARPDPFLQARGQEGHDGQDGVVRLIRLIRTVAWRYLRATRRRKAARWEVLGEDAMAVEGHHAITPLVEATGREALGRTLDLADEAARRFGGTRQDALRSALHRRLAGDTDTEAARACGVPREYVNRAKRWIGARLGAAEALA